jgi:hypothetical protein
MSKEYTPRGVTYKWTKDRVEYQLFPEEFFSGADMKIYFGDTFIEDIVSLQFVLQETVKPLYGYASRTHEEVARGRRTVEGVIAIAFREAGYLSSILDHIGQLGNIDDPRDNELNALVRGGTRQKWHGEVLQTFEEIMKELPRMDGDLTADQMKNYDEFGAYKRYTQYENSIWGRRNSKDSLNLNDKPFFYTSRGSVNHQQSLRKGGFDIFMTYGPIENSIKSEKGVSFNSTVRAIRGVELISTGQMVETDGTIVEMYQFIAKDVD